MQGEIADLLVFPILFAYRHWLELQLKSIITLGQRWRSEEVKPMHTHKLDVLWPIARAAIETAFPDDPADLDTIASIVGRARGDRPGGDELPLLARSQGSDQLAQRPRAHQRRARRLG